MISLRKLWFLGLPIGLLAACGQDLEATSNEDLTSKSAVEKNLTIKAYVYVDQNASDYTIESAVQRQIRTAFGPLRIGKISVDDREFRNIDKTSFVKTPVQVIKKGANGERQVLKTVQKVAYTYTARALVEKSQGSQGSFGFALLMGNYQAIVDEIIKDCTENYEEDRDFASSFWYVWSPNESSCKTIITKEVSDLQGEGEGLDEGQVGEKEYGRRYLPISAELKAVNAPKTTYPEYDKLFGLDDPSKDRIVIYQILGVASHDGDAEDTRFENDMGFAEYFKLFKVISDQWKTLKVATSSEANPLSVTFKGKTYTGTWAQLYSWVVNKSGFPSEIAYDDQRAFRRAIHDVVLLKWVKLELPITVTASGRGSKNMTIEFRFLFGTESGYNVRDYFKQAFKQGDVVIYDGHSYIGSGPLDPSNYSPTDFSDRYQILFFNSCVSFNYYGASFFKHKSSKLMDLVTNGLEVWINDGGKSMGQFMVALFNGKQSSWLTVLEQTAIKSGYWGTHDPNRNVDGELDNTFDPQATSITVKEGNGVAPIAVSNTTAGCNQTVGGSIQLSAESATATKVELFAGATLVATDTSRPFSASFDTRTVANGSLEIKVKASDASGGTAEASCTLTVSNTPVGTEPLFSDDMESAQTASNWTATGLWHLATNSTCATPGFASGANAFYFGQDAGCSYNTSKTVKGTLTSRMIAGVSASSKLSFQYFREVEKTSGSYDKTSVEVAVGSSTTFKKLWSKESKDASQKAWQSSGSLSLAEYAGKSIKIRFNFDSVDSYDNAHIGWLVDDVVVTP